ncbi:SIR2-domain-containing protein [Mycena polygramma]|nr:SIR2-domain-containing protein [Mycena polygramma]
MSIPRPASLEIPLTSTPELEISVLHSQIRAFLAASEEVDIDPESVEELVRILLLDTSNESSHISVQSPQSGGFDMEVSELDMSALYFFPDKGRYIVCLIVTKLFMRPAVQTWSPQQIRGMMMHLKEHGMSSFVQEYVVQRNLSIPQLLLAFGINLSPNLHNMSPATLTYFLRVAMSRELQLRDRLPEYNTVEDAVRLIRDSRRIIILTGAGISVSCGIPDFRSRDGLYASLKQKGDYELDDPQQMFDINFFRQNPAVPPPFQSFLSQIYPSNFVPSPCHRFIKLVESKNQNYTQNIDNLDIQCGVTRVLQCHGSFATASCLLCRRQVDGSEIEADIMAHRVPLCSVCNAPQPGVAPKPKKKKKSAKKAKGEWDSDDEDESDGPTYPPGIMKPDITFFGEKLTDNFDHSLAADRNQVDLLLVIGTSLKVSPVADILCHLPHSVPQILINKTPVRHINPDIILLGDADTVIEHLCHKLGWELPSPAPRTLAPSSSDSPEFLRDRKRSTSDLHALEEPRRVGKSHIWLFNGAEGGEWLRSIEQRLSSPDGLESESDSSPDTEQSPKKARLE